MVVPYMSKETLELVLLEKGVPERQIGSFLLGLRNNGAIRWLKREGLPSNMYIEVSPVLIEKEFTREGGHIFFPVGARDWFARQEDPYFSP